jgi:hypothetical protein
MPPKKKPKQEEEAKKEDEVEVKQDTKEEDQQAEEDQKVEEDQMVEEEDPDEEKEDAEAKEEEKQTDAEESKSKRKRRDAATYEPEDFTASGKAAVKVAPVVPGRGTILADLASVKASIEKCSPEEIPFAYKFLFTSRGKPTKKEMKQNLLEFSGYLPPLPKGKKLTEEELEEYDEEYEVSSCEQNARDFCSCVAIA